MIKIAPLVTEMRRFPDLEPVLIHTGQHYDDVMSEVFFQELDIPKPDYNLGVGSGTHTWQTAQVMLALEPLLVKLQPDCVLVVGDVNSTLAAVLVAASCVPLSRTLKLGFAVSTAHARRSQLTYSLFVRDIV